MRLPFALCPWEWVGDPSQVTFPWCFSARALGEDGLFLLELVGCESEAVDEYLAHRMEKEGQSAGI